MTVLRGSRTVAGAALLLPRAFTASVRARQANREVRDKNSSTSRAARRSAPMLRKLARDSGASRALRYLGRTNESREIASARRDSRQFSPRKAEAGLHSHR